MIKALANETPINVKIDDLGPDDAHFAKIFFEPMFGKLFFPRYDFGLLDFGVAFIYTPIYPDEFTNIFILGPLGLAAQSAAG